jgi:thioredoxin reductase
VHTDKGSYEAKAVILATGMVCSSRRRSARSVRTSSRAGGVYYKMPEMEYLVGKEVIFVAGATRHARWPFWPATNATPA